MDRFGRLLRLIPPVVVSGLLCGCPPGTAVDAPRPCAVELRHVRVTSLTGPPVVTEAAGEADSAPPRQAVRVGDVAFRDLGSPEGRMSCALHNASAQRRSVRITVTSPTTGRRSGPATWEVEAGRKLQVKLPVRLPRRGRQRVEVLVEDAADGRVQSRRAYRVDLPPVLAWDGPGPWIGDMPLALRVNVRPAGPAPRGLYLQVHATPLGVDAPGVGLRRRIYGPTAQWLQVSVGPSCRQVLLAARLLDEQDQPVTAWQTHRLRRLATVPTAASPTGAAGAPLVFGPKPPPWFEVLTGVPFGPAASGGKDGGAVVRMHMPGGPRADTAPLRVLHADLVGRPGSFHVPARHEIADRLHVRGARGQVVFVPLLVYARQPQSDLTVRCGDLADGRGQRISAASFRLFQQSGSCWFAPRPATLGERTGAKFILLIRLPTDAPSGRYSGHVEVLTGDRTALRVPITVDVEAFLLPTQTGPALMMPATQIAGGDWRVAGQRLLQMLGAWGTTMPPPSGSETGFERLASSWPAADALTRLRRWRPKAPLVIDWRGFEGDPRDALEIATGARSLLAPAGLPEAIHLVRPGAPDPTDGFARAWWRLLQNRGDQRVVLAADERSLAELQARAEDRFEAVLLSQRAGAPAAWLGGEGRALWWAPPANADATALRWAVGFVAPAEGAAAVVVPDRTAEGPILRRGAGGKYVPTLGWAALVEAAEDLRTWHALDDQITVAAKADPDVLAVLSAAIRLREEVRAAVREFARAGRRPSWVQMNLWRAALAAAANRLFSATQAARTVGGAQ
jgi:hypothetical protein